MKIPPFVFSLFLAGAASPLLLPGFDAAAQTAVATDPVGFATIALQANSDTLVSLPFTRPAEYTGPISSVSGGTVTLPSSTAFTANQYVYAQGTQPKTYYAIIGPLLTSLAGTVGVTNGSTTVTGSGFTPIASGDEILFNGLAYNVASVTSDTALVLSRAYTGTTATGLSASYNHSPKEGSYYTVTANGANTLTMNLNGDSLNAVAAGTSVSLIPYWTLGTAFPASDAGASYIATTGKAPATQILMPDVTHAGVNLSAATIYYYVSGGWRLSGGDASAIYDDTVLPPGEYFTVRNVAGTTLTPSGGVYMNRLSVPLATQTTTAQDNPVSVSRPSNVALNDLGLVASGAFAPTTGKAPADQLLVFDNGAPGINKSASAIYYYDTAWRLSGGIAGMDYGAVTLPYGAGFILRKTMSVTGTTAFWQNTRQLLTYPLLSVFPHRISQ